MINQVWEPRTIEELLLLKTENPNAALMAGGTDLLVWMHSGRRAVFQLIMTGRVPEMTAITVSDAELTIGAAVSVQQILDHQAGRSGWPLLYKALNTIGSPPIRHMATLGGNICSASPAGDSLPALYIMQARVELAGKAGRREVPACEFITGPGRTTIRDDEVLINIRIPRPPGSQRFGFIKLGQRQSLAISIASLAYAYTMGDQQKIDDIALAWGSVGPTVMRFPEIEAGMRGRMIDIPLLESAAPLVSARVQPIDDIRASAAYRRLVAGRMLYYLLE